jgi:hypothetical protein
MERTEIYTAMKLIRRYGSCFHRDEKAFSAGGVLKDFVDFSVKEAGNLSTRY